MVVIGALALGWFTFILAFVIFWSRLHAHVRKMEGIDEDAYLNGQQQTAADTARTAFRIKAAHDPRMAQLA